MSEEGKSLNVWHILSLSSPSVESENLSTGFDIVFSGSDFFLSLESFQFFSRYFQYLLTACMWNVHFAIIIPDRQLETSSRKGGGSTATETSSYLVLTQGRKEGSWRKMCSECAHKQVKVESDDLSLSLPSLDEDDDLTFSLLFPFWIKNLPELFRKGEYFVYFFEQTHGDFTLNDFRFAF